MSDLQQVSRTHVKNRSSKKQDLPPKNILSHHPHPAAIIQDARTAPGSLTPADVLQLQRTIGNQAVGQLLSEIGRPPSTSQQVPIQRQGPEEEEELMQGKFTDECVQCQIPEEEEELLQGKMMDTVQRQEPEEEELMQGKFASGLTDTLQAKEEVASNRTGMPDHLKSGIENLSGMDLSGVRVHYSSSKPPQLNALAYAQGSDIHVAPGQERHLPHEAWHVVQQAQGRVKPTMQLKDGVPVNDDQGLEHEADVMGRRANAVPATHTPQRRKEFSGVKRQGKESVLQRALWTNEPAKFRTDNEDKTVPNSEYLVNSGSFKRYAPINLTRAREQVYHEGPRNFVYLRGDVNKSEFDPAYEGTLSVTGVAGDTVTFTGSKAKKPMVGHIKPIEGDHVLDMPVVDQLNEDIHGRHPGHAVEDLGKTLPTLDDPDATKAAKDYQYFLLEQYQMLYEKGLVSSYRDWNKKSLK